MRRQRISDVLHREGQRVAHMQAAGDVRRRDHDGEGLCRRLGCAAKAPDASQPHRSPLRPRPVDRSCPALLNARSTNAAEDGKAAAGRRRLSARRPGRTSGRGLARHAADLVLHQRSTMGGRLVSSHSLSIGRSSSRTSSSRVRLARRAACPTAFARRRPGRQQVARARRPTRRPRRRRRAVVAVGHARRRRGWWARRRWRRWRLGLDGGGGFAARAAAAGRDHHRPASSTTSVSSRISVAGGWAGARRSAQAAAGVSGAASLRPRR